MKKITDKERDVLDLMLAGLSTKQIAHKLNIPEGTVKDRKQCIFLFFGVSTAAQLFARILSRVDVEKALMEIEAEVEIRWSHPTKEQDHG